jgi:RES domain-containing protein
VLFRVFPLIPGAGPSEDGGPLFVPRSLQGSSRHDNPGSYGALYASRRAESAVAERIQPFRGRELTSAHLRRADGRRYALASIDDAGLGGVVDLDDPQELSRRGLRPSTVATRNRAVTQPVALAIFEEGSYGFAWWSTLEAAWTNVTLFAERAVPELALAGAPEPLSLDHPVVTAAARLVGVKITASAR